MKLNSYSRISMASIASAVILFNMQACGKYPDGPNFSLKSKKGRLTGEWELVDPVEPGQEVIVEFEDDGDVRFSLTYSYYGIPYTFRIKGEWEFTNDKGSIELDFDNEITEWDINRLTHDELWVEDEDGYEYEFEKM